MADKAGVASKELSIFYYDCENDKVAVQDDDDIQMAYAIAGSTDRKVKFIVEFRKAVNEPTQLNQQKDV